MNIKYDKPQGFYFYPDIFFKEEEQEGQKIKIKNIKQWLRVKQQKYIISSESLAIKRLSDGKIFFIEDFVETKDLKIKGRFTNTYENKIDIAIEFWPDNTCPDRIIVDVDDLI